jgi:hypothetical protein
MASERFIIDPADIFVWKYYHSGGNGNNKTPAD